MKMIPLPIHLKNGISASPDFLMALAFFATWIDPTALGNDMLNYCMLIMLLEFITIHSAGFLGFAILLGKSKFQKILRVIGLGLLYSIFIWAFSGSSGEFWPLLTFWFLLLNRILGVLLGDDSSYSLKGVIIIRWAWSIFCFLMSIMITALLPIPQFGWSNTAVNSIPSTGSGLWIDEPQTLLAAGCIYFLSIGIFEMFSHLLTGKFAGIEPTIPISETNNQMKGIQ